MNSTVYLAFDPYLKRDIAVKEVEKSKLGNDLDSFCVEARAMFAAADEHIVPIEYVCETADKVAFALPYFANGSLKDRIKNKPLVLKEFLQLGHGILLGLSRIHASGFLHLDLKPSNILFNDSDRPLIADFGQSRKVSATGIVNSPILYKWSMAPEVIATNAATAVADIYQLGVLLYRAVNGESVYALQKSQITTNGDLRNKIDQGRFPDRNTFLPHVPKRIRTIIRKAMRVNPSERFRSSSDFAAVLGKVNLPLDWETTPLGPGSYRWRAVRSGKTNLQVELTEDKSGWMTKVWTTRAGSQRRLKVTAYWREKLKYKEAWKHLTEVFADLNQ